MSIGGIGNFAAGLGGITPGISTPAGTEGAAAGGGGFAQMLSDLTDVSQAADGGLQSLATGGSTDLHDITLSMELESLSFDLAVQIRNKLVDAYQEIFRMQV